MDSSGLENPLDIGFNMQHMGPMNFLTPGFNQFRPILGLTDHHLPAGLTAFRKFILFLWKNRKTKVLMEVLFKVLLRFS